VSAAYQMQDLALHVCSTAGVSGALHGVASSYIFASASQHAGSSLSTFTDQH